MRKCGEARCERHDYMVFFYARAHTTYTHTHKSVTNLQQLWWICASVARRQRGRRGAHKYGQATVRASTRTGRRSRTARSRSVFDHAVQSTVSTADRSAAGTTLPPLCPLRDTPPSCVLCTPTRVHYTLSQHVSATLSLLQSFVVPAFQAADHALNRLFKVLRFHKIGIGTCCHQRSLLYIFIFQNIK